MSLHCKSVYNLALARLLYDSIKELNWFIVVVVVVVVVVVPSQQFNWFSKSTGELTKHFLFAILQVEVTRA